MSSQHEGAVQAAHPTIPASPMVAWARRALRLSFVRDYGIVFSFLSLFIALSFASDAFLTKTNLLNICDQWSPTAIVAIGSTLVLISGGFDLSAGAIFALAGVVTGLTVGDIGVAPAIALGCGAGFAVGVVNGCLTTIGRINPFIATLAVSTMVAGIALALTGGDFVTVANSDFNKLGLGSFLGITFPIWTAIAIALACGFALARTTFGRYIYASGDNAEAARLSGVRVGFIRSSAFAVCGTCAGMAGVIQTSRVSTAQADGGGFNLVMDAVTAVVIGGTSIWGGAGAIWRTVLGILLLAMIGNGFNLMNIDPTYQRIVQGGIILAAVALDAWAKRSET